MTKTKIFINKIIITTIVIKIVEAIAIKEALKAKKKTECVQDLIFEPITFKIKRM